MNKTLVAIIAVATVLGCVLTNLLGGVLAGVLAWLMVQFRYFGSNDATITRRQKVFTAVFAVVLALGYCVALVASLVTGHWLAAFAVVVVLSALFAHVIVGIVRRIFGR